MSKEELMSAKDEEYAVRWELPALVGSKLDVISVLVGPFEQEKERLGFVEAAIQNIEMNGNAGNRQVNVVLAINAVMERSTGDQFVGIMAPGEPSQSDPRFLLEQELPPGPISHKTVKAVSVEIPPDTEFCPETGNPDLRIVHIHPYWLEDGLCLDVVLTVNSPGEDANELPAAGEEWEHSDIEVTGTGFPRQGETVALAWRVGESAEAAAKVLAQVVLDPGENNPLIMLESKRVLELPEIILGPPQLIRQGEQWTLSGVAKVKTAGPETNPETNIEPVSPYAQAFLDNPLDWYRGLAPTAPSGPKPTENSPHQAGEISGLTVQDKEDMVTNRTELELPEEMPVTAEITGEDTSAVIVAQVTETPPGEQVEPPGIEPEQIPALAEEEEAVTEEQAATEEEVATEEEAVPEEGFEETNEETSTVIVTQVTETPPAEPPERFHPGDRPKTIFDEPEENVPVQEAKGMVPAGASYCRSGRRLARRPEEPGNYKLPPQETASPAGGSGFGKWSKPRVLARQSGEEAPHAGQENPQKSRERKLGVWKMVVLTPGETLASIAQVHGVPVTDICRLNQLKNEDDTEVGRALLIPRKV